MSAILSWALEYVLLPLLLMIIKKEENALVQWVQSKIESSNQQKQDKENVSAVKAAAESGDHDALANAEEDLLNGSKHSDPK